MNIKIVSGTVLIILLTSMLSLAFDVKPVDASGTVYIRDDGRVEPSTANIENVDNMTYIFTGNIYDEIVVERDNIVIDGASLIVQGTGAIESVGIDLTRRNNVTIKNTNIKNFYYGIVLASSSGDNIFGNNITDNVYGIGYGNDLANLIFPSSNNNVYGNNITDNQYGIHLVFASSNNSIAGNNIANNHYGIYLDYSSDNNIAGNSITNNDYGIDLTSSVYSGSSNYNNIVGNNITNKIKGIRLYSSFYNSITGNNITNNAQGIYLSESSDNKFYHNNFIDNSQQVYIETPSYANLWDDGYPSGGNYWSNYTGADVKSGPNQDQPSSDGIGDTPYTIDTDNQDKYPLMKPYALSPHDIGITSVTTSKTIIGQGYSMNITVTVENQGDFTETFRVSALYDELVIPTPEQWETFWSMGDVNVDGYIDLIDYDIIQANLNWTGAPGENPADIDNNGSVDFVDLAICAEHSGLNIWACLELGLPPIETQTVLNLTNGTSTVINFNWKTTGVAKGNYTIRAYVWSVIGETYTIDNTYTDGTVAVAMRGDLNADGTIDILDITMVAIAFGSYCYDPNLDIDDNGTIDIVDITIIAIVFGTTDQLP